MITEAIINVFAAVVAFLVGLLPSWTAPDWLGAAVSTMASAIGDITMLSGWVPVKAVGTAVAFMLACSGIGMAVKVARMVLSLSTGGGGSAG